MKYQVKVDGRVYEVEVERAGGSSRPMSMADFGAPQAPAAPQYVAPQPAPQYVAPQPAPTPQPAPAPQAAPQPAPAPAKAPSGNGEAVESPMPGTILRVNVKDGDTVSAGDVILILEAMKMENEIVAPADGTVSLNVKQGDTVDTDQVLAEIK
ncbi:biotin/lipoyl-binding protein [Peptoniphilus equinus]|uniref:Biotin/lipoyl-binding protein n=1 Tax=Peptoniphilus equinus TaxID=3016343 RepID=A0ABY7QT33_9FIRM|nr:biotin/lipoyl-containing protein [Peptoniphilus equinus]WBW49953.1 biotin/lipoyl-binding protein [Peptoniphilus equinus]